jgi:hypothetical protein
MNFKVEKIISFEINSYIYILPVDGLSGADFHLLYVALLRILGASPNCDAGIEQTDEFCGTCKVMLRQRVEAVPLRSVCA